MLQRRGCPPAYCCNSMQSFKFACYNVISWLERGLVFRTPNTFFDLHSAFWLGISSGLVTPCCCHTHSNYTNPYSKSTASNLSCAQAEEAALMASTHQAPAGLSILRGLGPGKWTHGLTPVNCWCNLTHTPMSLAPKLSKVATCVSLPAQHSVLGIKAPKTSGQGRA